jgi:F420-dependent oxidoreductase-like protein
MPSGVIVSPDRNSANVIDDIIDKARCAQAAGVGQVWLAQNFDFDALALAAVLGAAVPGLSVGTSVVPINPRHPLIIASGAQTAQAATHGKFSLGVGLGAHFVEEQAFGIAPANTIARLREHLTVLRAVIHDRTVDFHGSQITAVDTGVMPVALAGSTPFPVYVAAMGPRALQVTGELADGTLPYLAGPRSIEEFVAPTIGQAAATAGRPKPEIIAMVPVAVTHDVDVVRAEAAASLAFYETVPSYRKVLAREGVSTAGELAVVGDAEFVTRRLKSYIDAGATDVALVPLQSGADDLRRVWEVAAAF